MVNADNEVLAAFEGLCYEAVSRETLARALRKPDTRRVYRTDWVVQPPSEDGPAHVGASDGCWLIFADDGGVGARLHFHLAGLGQTSVLVQSGDSYQESAGGFQVRPGEPEDFLKLMEAMRGVAPFGCRGVVHLWSLDATIRAESSAAELMRMQAHACGSVLHLVQALGRDVRFNETALYLVTRGAQAVARTDGLQPAQTSIWGLGRTVAQEYPELRCSLIDLEPAARDELVGDLAEELLGDRREREIAFRGRSRHVSQLVRHEVDRPLRAPVIAEGTYLITGGTGALGLHVAGWLVDQGARHLLLVSRNGVSSDAARAAIERWNREGIDVGVISADISQWSETNRVFEEVRRRGAALRGVLHLAGVLEDGMLQRQSWLGFDRVMAAKVAGCWNLHVATRDLPLDFFVAFSSIAAALGSPGQGNYSAANAFLDGLMLWRVRAGLPGLAINWGPWAGAGMAAATKGTLAGLRPLDASDALQAMSALIRQRASQAVVADIDWDLRRQQAAGSGVSHRDLDRLARGGGEPAAAEGTLRTRLKGTASDEQFPLLIRFVQGLVGQSLGMARHESIDVNRGFFDLGLDSLAVTMLRNQLQTSLGTPLPATIAFEHSTVLSLCRFVAECLLGMKTPPDTANPARRATKRRPDSHESMADLDSLSEEELADRLASRLATLKTDHGKH
ncbi:MAG: SDR family NAD(P)-dependent oxidoreductase [Planctomycetes bacterium]|nr:SDR family NAD(P)-dependent oxidoreductase [Planctomycetota bacterium]